MSPAAREFRPAASPVRRFAQRSLFKVQRAITPAGHAGRLENVSLEVTIVCNLRCPFCWWWGDKGVAFEMVKTKAPLVSEQLSFAEIKGVLEELARLKANVYLSGGEPFARKDCIEIIEYASELGLEVSLTTNGTLIDDATIRRMAGCAKLHTVVFSVDGPEDVHDKIRGAGHYQKTFATARKLVEARGTRSTPWVCTNSTLTHAMSGRVRELIDSIRANGFDYANFQHLWFTDAAHGEAHGRQLKEDFGIIDDGWKSHVMDLPGAAYGRAILQELEAVRAALPEFQINQRPELTPEQAARYYSDLGFSVHETCYSPWQHLIIKANGDMIFCPDQWISGYPVGNVREGSVEQRWNGERAAKFREKLTERRLWAGCARCCRLNEGRVD